MRRVHLDDYPEFDGYITGRIDDTEERYIPDARTRRRRELERQRLGLTVAEYDELVHQKEAEEVEVDDWIRECLVSSGCIKK